MNTALRIIVFDTETQDTQTRDFSRSPVRIGRHPKNDLILDFPFVSAWHAEVRLDEKGARLCDLGSSNGLVIDGKQLPRGATHPIAGGLRAFIGHIELHVEWGRGAEPRDSARDRRQAQGSIDTETRPNNAESGTRAIPMERLHAVIRRLQPLHDQTEDARRAFDSAFTSTMEEFRRASDPQAIAVLREAFPGRDLTAMGPPEVHGQEHARSFEQAELGEIARVAEAVAPGFGRPVSLAEGRRFLEDALRILQVFARGLVDLQEARARQASELGFVAPVNDNPLLSALSDERDILKFLLDWRTDGVHRTEALHEAFSWIFAHQRGLVQGSVQGCQRVVEYLAPADIERGVQALWPTRAGALWRRFEERYEALVGGPVPGVPPILNRHFADAYRQELAKSGFTVDVKEDKQS